MVADEVSKVSTHPAHPIPRVLEEVALPPCPGATAPGAGTGLAAPGRAERPNHRGEKSQTGSTRRPSWHFHLILRAN